MEDVLGSLATASAGGGQPSRQNSADLVSALGQMLGGAGQGGGGQLGGAGGLGSLINSFDQAGLGNLVNSWVGTGANQAPTPQNIEQGLGADTLGQLAKRAGITPQMAASMLAVALPMIIDKLTPQGQVPQQSSMGSLLGSLLGGGQGH